MELLRLGTLKITNLFKALFLFQIIKALLILSQVNGMKNNKQTVLVFTTAAKI